MLLPIERLAVIRSFPRERYLPALAFIAIPSLIGPLIGPMLGGWLTETASWHWIFLINVPVGLIGCIATAFYMHGDPLPCAGRFDVQGYLMLAVAMLSITLALDGTAELGLTRAVVLGLVALAFASLAAFGHQTSVQTLSAFHATFACIGFITASSALVFAQFKAEAPTVGSLPARVEDA
jgi:MFS family permease